MSGSHGIGADRTLSLSTCLLTRNHGHSISQYVTYVILPKCRLLLLKPLMYVKCIVNSRSGLDTLDESSLCHYYHLTYDMYIGTWSIHYLNGRDGQSRLDCQDHTSAFSWAISQDGQGKLRTGIISTRDPADDG